MNSKLNLFTCAIVFPFQRILHFGMFIPLYIIIVFVLLILHFGMYIPFYIIIVFCFVDIELSAYFISLFSNIVYKFLQTVIFFCYQTVVICVSEIIDIMAA